MSKTPASAPPAGGRNRFVNRADRLGRSVRALLADRAAAGLDGLVGPLQFVIVNTEPAHQRPAVEELLRYTGLEFEDAFAAPGWRGCVLRCPGGVQFLVTARLAAANPFAPCSGYPSSSHLPGTRLETFVFETPDIDRYVQIQNRRGTRFLTDAIVQAETFRFIQTTPSVYTGTSVGVLQWRRGRDELRFPGSRSLRWKFPKPDGGYQQRIGLLDHAAARVRAEDRDPAILEFLGLTNYTFAFAITVDSLNSITNVARLDRDIFAMVFTSGISPYVDDAISGPTEKFVHNYGPRVHHIAFDTKQIDRTYAALQKDGMEFLVELVGSRQEGLKQTFTVASRHTLLVNEYIHRYDGFDGFFTRSNVTRLTEVTGKQ